MKRNVALNKNCFSGSSPFPAFGATILSCCIILAVLSHETQRSSYSNHVVSLDSFSAPLRSGFDLNLSVTTSQLLNWTSGKKFDLYFENEEISDFKKSHIAACRPGRRFLGSFLWNNNRLVGFGSMLNFALVSYLFASEPEVDRTFQLYTFNWSYEPLTTFFVDFAEKTLCPVLCDLNLSKGHELLQSASNFTLKVDQERHFDVRGTDKAALFFAGPKFGEITDWVHVLESRDGREAIYHRKSLIARALWNPVSELKELIKTFWRTLVKESGSYFAVHIRRGDKLSKNEMQSVPLENYYEDVFRWCVQLNTSCPKHIFVTSDEPELIQWFRIKTRRYFIVSDLTKLVKEAGLDVEDNVVRLHGRSPFLIAKTSLKKNFWHLHTKELIMTITLLAMADNLVCMFSSNICRLVLLLRTDGNFDSVHSLDIKDPFYIFSCLLTE